MIDIITEIMVREGWDKYTNHPADRGGPTKWGITAKAWSAYIDRLATEDDIKDITEEEARDFYEEVYVLGPSFHKIINPHLRELVIDCGVNHGVRRGAKWVQRSVFVKQDGVIGPKTLAAINSRDPLEVYLEVIAYRVKLYGRLISKNHSQAVFAAGWNNRAAGFLEQAGDRIAQGKDPV